MKNTGKRSTAISKALPSILLALLLLMIPGCGGRKVTDEGWNRTTEQAINDFIELYGKDSENYSENSYVVTDFDNSTSIFDVCEQFMIYQAEVMGFGFTPEQLPDILASGLGDMDRDLTDLGYGKGSYRDWIGDITDAYAYLYENYGPFTPAGLEEDQAAKVREDPMWLEFSVKLRVMYELVGDNESTDVSYPWITYWYTGMTPEEVYTLACESHEKYRQVETSSLTRSTPETVESRVGVVSYTYVYGIQVTENVLDMWKRFAENGIDMWVCSASEANIIRAAVDVFGLHDYCAGVIGMTPTTVDGKLSYEYDYETGYAWIPEADGSWSRGEVASGAQIQRNGKVTAIENICVSRYGCGPLAGFMDSTGDFNFCTEFDSLKLVICFNRADRKVTDGGGLIAELAVWQEDVLGYDLKTANAAGDTFYVLQGRDENGLRTLRASRETVRLGETEPKLFRDEKNEAQLQAMKDGQMTTAEILDRFALVTSAEDPDNPLGFAYGFLEEYSGYHSR